MTIYAPLFFERLALRGVRTPVVRTGMGPGRARRAQLAGPALVAGVAGSLSPEVLPGDVVVADEVRGAGKVVPIPSAPLLAGELRRCGLPVHLGPIVSVEKTVTNAKRRALAAQGALAVDMESAWLAPENSNSHEAHPFAVVRTIVDTEDDPLWSPATLRNGIKALASLRTAGPVLDQWADAVGPRQIRLASPRSFCAGVERAIDIVERALERYGAPVYVRREVVHNAHVVGDLRERGAVFVTELDEVPRGAVAVLAAHGVAPSVRATARERGLTVIDGTCPLVAKVHAEVKRHTSHGNTVLLIGHGEHEEVQGTVGEAPDDIIVVEDAAAARTVRPRDPERVTYAMQTTLALHDAREITDVLRDRFPAISGPRTDDICYATTNRQDAVLAIASECDVVLVVGSTNSSNSQRLVEVARRHGVAAHLVDDAEGVDFSWLVGARRIGITAGASAPPRLVEEIVHCLEGLGPVTKKEKRVVSEDVRFTLPREVS